MKNDISAVRCQLIALTSDYKRDDVADLFAAGVADTHVLSSIIMTRRRKSHCLVTLVKMSAFRQQLKVHSTDSISKFNYVLFVNLWTYFLLKKQFYYY